MNINRTNSQQNFTSTLIPYASKKPVSFYLSPLKDFFELKGFGKESPEALRDKIKLSQAAIGFNKDGLLVVGKDRGADNFIGRILQKLDSNVKHVDDAPELEINGPELNIMI